jgi:heme exporter protein A
VGGQPVVTSDARVRGRIGVLSHQTFLYGHLTAAENLAFYASLYGVRDRDRVSASLDRVGLAGRAHSFVKGFSRGMRQRLALARTLLHEPDLVLLDEPYTGLDAHAAVVLRDVLGALKDGKRTVVMVTHNLAEGLEMADRVAVQVRGRWVYDASGDEARGKDFARYYVGLVDASG